MPHICAFFSKTALKITCGLSLQREIKGSTTPWRSLCPDSAAMAMYNSLNGYKPHSITFKLFHRMKALKYTKKFIRVFHIEARTIIFYKVCNLLLFCGAPKFYSSIP